MRLRFADASVVQERGDSGGVYESSALSAKLALGAMSPRCSVNGTDEQHEQEAASTFHTGFPSAGVRG